MKKKLLLTFFTAISIFAFTGCGNTESSVTDIATEIQNEEYDFENMTFDVEGYRTEFYYLTNGKETEQYNLSFRGSIQNPQKVKDDIYSGIISNACYSTAKPVEVSAITGEVITDKESIEILPTVPFSEDLMISLLYKKPATIDYELKDSSNAAGFVRPEIVMSEDTIASIRFATVDDNTEKHTDELMYSSNMSWKGALYITTTDGLIIRADVSFDYRPDREIDYDDDYDNERWINSEPEDFWSYEIYSSNLYREE